MFRALIVVLGQVAVVIAATVALFTGGLFGRSDRHLAFWSLLWSRTILRLSGVRLTIEGIERTKGCGPSFFVGNHPGALDIPVVFRALNGHVRFLAKKSLFRIPFFGWILSRYGFVPIDRSHPRVALRELERLLVELRKNPASFAVFPEGTRSPEGRLLPFRKGSLKICRDSGMPVVPFAIEGTNRVYTRGRWRIDPGPVRISFGEPVTAEVVATMSTQELHDRVRGDVARLLGRPHDAATTDPTAAIVSTLATDAV